MLSITDKGLRRSKQRGYRSVLVVKYNNCDLSLLYGDVDWTNHEKEIESGLPKKGKIVGWGKEKCPDTGEETSERFEVDQNE